MENSDCDFCLTGSSVTASPAIGFQRRPSRSSVATARTQYGLVSIKWIKIYCR